MCHRFHIKTPVEDIADVIKAINRCEGRGFQQDLFPLQEIPIVRHGCEGEYEVVPSVWSLLHRSWKPNQKFATWKSFVRKYPTFNARCETIEEKFSFRQSFQDRRALIPCTGFFEHGQYFGLNDQPTMYFAGLWDRCEVDGEPIDSCTIITTRSNQMVGRYHPRQRMPVILRTPESRELWMDTEAQRDVVNHLFQPTPDDQMKRWDAETEASGQ